MINKVKGYLPLVVAGALYRAVPDILDLLRRRYTVSITIRDNDLYYWFKEWISEVDYYDDCKKYIASVVYKEEDNNEKSTPVVLYSPGEGKHFIRYKGNWVLLDKTIERFSFSDRSYQHNTLQLVAPGKDPAILKELVEEIRAFGEKLRRDKIRLYYNNGWADWSSMRFDSGRGLDSVILKEGEKQELVKDVEWFLNAKTWYKDKGIPYRRGYLFYGPPGTGKSSLAKALATHFRMDIFTLSLSGNLDDDKLQKMFNGTKSGSMILIEDVDSAFIDRDKKENNNSVTFSGLLNCLDGVGSQEGTILILTTNHPDRLDEALVRPGRVDIKKYFGLSSKYQAKEMFLKFFPDHEPTAERFANELPEHTLAPAEIQNYLLLNRDSHIDALWNIDDLMEQRND